MTGPVLRPVLRLLTVLVVVGASLLSPVATSTPVQQAQAADARQFDPGNIISDAVFFDGRAMDAGAIQEFLRSKSPSSCAAAATDGSPCLEDYRLTTTTVAPDGLCAGYQGAARESAATIIAKVAVSCRISPRVILVLLQKEMGFITSSNPTAKMYDRAAGYYCPDIGTGWCHPDYAGLQKQLYNAGKQYQRYATYPKNYSYRAGFDNTIQWSVPTSCGTSVVRIQNQATAGLYNYTPYRPNQAALNAGYGTGDRCSAYGNRNFWLYFTDWFGSTQSTGGAAIAARAAQPDAVKIGRATSGTICGLIEGGCFRAHEFGAVYWTPGTGAHLVLGAIHSRWAELGWEKSRLGYPVGSESCGLRDGGCFQDFQNGAVYWSPATGAQAVEGSIRTKWASLSWETGYLGYPSGAQKCGLVQGGCYQQFQGGRIYWSTPSKAHVMVTGALWNHWRAQGYESGPLGYPTGDQRCGLRDGGCFQEFEKATVYWSAATGAQPVLGAIQDKWASTKWETGYLGYPSAPQTCGLAGEGCFQQYQGGRIYVSPASRASVMVTGPVWDLWGTRGYEKGFLGYPTGDQTCGLADAGCTQTFQKGTVYVSASHPARYVYGKVLDRYAAAGAQAGTLGYPVADTVCGLVDRGCFQDFEAGSIYTSTSAGTHTVLDGPLRTVWDAQKWETGPLGYPIRDQVCGLRRGGCGQLFQGGAVYSTPASGTWGIRGAINRDWVAQGREGGQLGYPASAETCGLPGARCRQFFEGGTIVHSPTTGTHAVQGEIGKLWHVRPTLQAYPTNDEFCGLIRGGCYQKFEKAYIYWSPTTGAHAVGGKILSTWGAQGWERGALGYPTGPAVTSATAITQPFEGGTLEQNRSTGKVTRR